MDTFACFNKNCFKGERIGKGFRVMRQLLHMEYSKKFTQFFDQLTGRYLWTDSILVNYMLLIVGFTKDWTVSYAFSKHWLRFKNI